MPDRFVVLVYKRVRESHTGWVVLRDKGISAPIRGFSSTSFAKMMTYFSDALRAHEDAGAVIERNDRPGIKSMPLGPEFTELLRNDPVAAIRSMTVEAICVQESNPPRQAVLRVGHDSMADAFGDKLYIRRRFSVQVECPGCGRWVRVFDNILECIRCIKDNKPVRLTVELLNDVNWACTPTKEVLALKHDKFFFPRAWNNGRVWVKREDLKSRYEQFVKEKEEACSIVATKG